MANSGAHPNSASSSFPFERLPRSSEASSWPGYARCLRRESWTCPIWNSRYLPTGLAGSPCFTASALVLYAKRPFGGPNGLKLPGQLHPPRRAEQPPYRRRRCAASERHLHLSRLPAWFTAQRFTLSALKFIRRFSLHILPPGLVVSDTMEFWAIIAEDVISKQHAQSLSAAGAPWSFSRRALWICRVAERVRCAEKPEFVWWPLPMPPAFCT